MNSMKTSRAWVVAGMSIGAVAIVAVIAFGSSGAMPTALAQALGGADSAGEDLQTEVAPTTRVTVDVATAVLRDTENARAFAGRVEAARTVDFAFQVSGQLLELAVDAGDRVAQGALIAALDPADFELAVDRARATFDLARTELDRATSLAERGVTADAQLQIARAQFAQAEVALREAERHLSQTTISAPWDALVARTLIEEFANITPAAPVVRLQDVSEMRIRLSVPEDLAAIAQANADMFDIVALFPAIPGYEAELVGRAFATDADPAAQTYDFEFAIIGDVDPRLLPGMTANVLVSLRDTGDRASSVVVVPVSAIDTTSEAEPTVWVYDDTTGQVRRQSIRIGLPQDNEIAVLEGLSGGETVVSGGWWRLRDGEVVAVR